MSLSQILLSLPSFPDVAPEQVLEGACALTRILGGRLTAQIPQLSGDQATWPAVMGTFLLDFQQLMNEAVVQSEANAATMSAALIKLCSESKLNLDLRRCLTTLHASNEDMVDLARLHDLVVLPAPESPGFEHSAIQAAIFDTGRPVVLLPSHRKSLQSLDRLVVAWDYSREAARALSDAMPLLASAKQVHVISVFGEKGIHTTSTVSDFDRFLAVHNIKYVRHQETLKSTSIGEFLMQYAMDLNADMLVMGAYGHSRLREFVLGGATRGILGDPLLPVFLSR
jgi:nucleotide-binding universal stress UspA family protein